MVHACTGVAAILSRYDYFIFIFFVILSFPSFLSTILTSSLFRVEEERRILLETVAYSRSLRYMILFELREENGGREDWRRRRT